MEQDGLTCTGFYSLATGAAAVALLTHIPQDANGIYQARAALIRAVGQDSNVTLDNTTPTTAATGGYPVKVSDTGGFWIYGLANLERFKAIAVTGTGSIAVLFFN